MHGFNLPGLAVSLINFFSRANRYKFIFVANLKFFWYSFIFLRLFSKSFF